MVTFVILFEWGHVVKHFMGNSTFMARELMEVDILEFPCVIITLEVLMTLNLEFRYHAIGACMKPINEP